MRRVQELRKQAGFDIADRIQLYVQGTPNLVAAIQEYKDYIQDETLAVQLSESEPPEDAATKDTWFDGQWAKFGITKA